MLRSSVFRSTAGTGVELTVTHALGAVPDVWWISARNGIYGTYFASVATAMLTNTLHIANDRASNSSVQVFALNYQGRLY